MGWNLPDNVSENDPNAPWNDCSDEEAYGEQAQERITEEMNDRGDRFDEWLAENGYTPDESEVTESTYEKICELLAEDDVVFRKYYEYRKDDIFRELEEESASYQDYCECEAYERERDE